MKNRAVFLDRDGVLNESIVKNGKPYPPASLEELVITKDCLTALETLKHAGFLLIGATNQPDVARGTTERHIVEAINEKLMQCLPLDDICVCYHDDKDGCFCRKPLPGLLVDAAKKYQIDLENSIMIGDRWKDIAAGQNAGCKTIFLDRQYQEQQSEKPADFVTKSLLDAAKWIKESTYLTVSFPPSRE